MQVQVSLVEEPTLRFAAAGHAVSNVRVAVNDRTQDRATGEWKDTAPT